ncbi:hypothetical protein IEC338SC_3101 [Acinetobacter pittii]|uniref:DUF551 domain-containing protein n=1 Tax=Acinetobacter pittii TaxID=48296 RepID=A0AB33BAE7_ACIPI|nr:hypothetical protein [Acinetobacter pittii]AMX20215.1 hypothetical protein IEC338SC_3101 [Acinetobacter pittii]
MTDLNKLRSEFESIKEIQDSIRREQLIFNNKLGCYTKKSGKMCVSANWTNGAWFLFERKAKAQAVPVWISTDFMKPDDHDYVDILINAERRIVDAVYLDGKFFIFPPFSKEQWTEVNNKVTHWMPRVDIASKSGAEQ